MKSNFKAGLYKVGDAPILKEHRVAVIVFSDYSNDPRPRRAAEALSDKGIKVEVMSVKQNAIQPSRLTLNGVNVFQLPIRFGRGGKLSYLFQYLGFFGACFFLLTARSFTRRYSLVHIHNMPDILIFSALIPKLLGAKIILDLHDPMPELMQTIFEIPENHWEVRWLSYLEKVSIKFADAVITVNETCKEIFSKRSGRPDKIRVIMNSPDEKLFPLESPIQREVNKCPFVVMYHGSLVERNGLGLAVEALSLVKMKSPAVELHIYGARTPFLEVILWEIERGGCSSWIHYKGPKKIEEIVEAIDDCDLGIIPNLRNRFTEINTPTRIFEFLIRGKTVIAPSSQGILEYFNKDQLLMFKIGDAQDLANRIEFAIKNPKQIFEITQRGQAVCATHLWSQEKLEWISLVDELLG